MRKTNSIRTVKLRGLKPAASSPLERHNCILPTGLNKVIPVGGLILCCMLAAYCPQARAESFKPFRGEVTSEGINVRADATTTSEIVCTLKKDEPFEVVAERYGWYKIRLPKPAPLYIRKDMLEPLEGKTYQVSKENVNLRLRPNESALILGKADRGEVLTVLEEKEGWYRITPVPNSFAWVHAKFVRKSEAPEEIKAKGADSGALKETPAVLAEEGKEITVEGLVKPKTIKTIASHKLIIRTGRGKDLYLLKGDRAELNTFNSRNARVTGTVEYGQNLEYPSIIVTKVEALD
ncbi:MAG: SH3 domain-containing protein [Candidatus Omnitrophica bacterium]|nr:SH3 domain-containing protein [Candidatus Omnitrophota bacterium]